MSDNDELFDQASGEWEAGNLEKAFDLFERAAEQGDDSSQSNLGYFYDVGIGIEADKEKAMFWYLKAAENGSPGAHNNIANLYREKGEFTSAKAWLEKATLSFDDGDAYLELAKLYLDGSLPNENDEARRNLELVLKAEFVSEDAIEEAQALLDKMPARPSSATTKRDRKT